MDDILDIFIAVQDEFFVFVNKILDDETAIFKGMKSQLASQCIH